MEEEQRSNLFNPRSINQVMSQTPYDSPVTHIQDDLAIHYFGRSVVDVSAGLARDTMVSRLIENIRVSINKKEYETIKNESHHSVTPELLVRKWGIGLENSKETLKATTQNSICSSLIPITSGYHTDLILQRLRGLS